jgi:cyclopropane fatty-acyl-phospholipid synthase-like methyltransferase
MAQNDLYDAYPNDQFHMRDYVAYQQRYALKIRESDRVILDHIAEDLRRRGNAAGCELLDIGCSTGNLLRHIKGAFPQLRLTGGELSEMQLEICRKDEELQGISFVRADLKALPTDRPYDIIVANAILYGFDQPAFEQCIASIAGALRPGGTLIAFDFFHPWKQEIAIVEKTGTFPGGHPLHFRSFGSTRPVLERCGLTQAQFTPFAIPIDLARPPLDTDHVESYTVPTAAGERLLFRGAICQPWCHLVARKIR